MIMGSKLSVDCSLSSSRLSSCVSGLLHLQQEQVKLNLFTALDTQMEECVLPEPSNPCWQWTSMYHSQAQKLRLKVPTPAAGNFASLQVCAKRSNRLLSSLCSSRPKCILQENGTKLSFVKPIHSQGCKTCRGPQQFEALQGYHCT